MLNLTKLNQKLYTKLYTDITEFRKTFDLPVGCVVDDKSDQLHTSLAIEEMTELAQADCKVEQADAIVDTVYVLMGRVVHAGYDSIMDLTSIQSISVCTQIDLLLHTADNLNINFLACWDNIHASNMSKACATKEDFEETKRHYASLGIKVAGHSVADKIVVKCEEDFISEEKTIRKGKVLKSVYYTPANLEPLM